MTTVRDTETVNTNQRKMAQHTYQLTVYNGKKQTAIEIFMLEKGQEMESLSYTAPVLFPAGSRIRMHIDGEKKEYLLPENLTKPLELLEFAIGTEEKSGTETLVIRRHEQPDETYEIQLEEEFEADIQCLTREVPKAIESRAELSAYRKELACIQKSVQENGYVNLEDFTNQLREINQEADRVIQQYDQFLKKVSQDVIELQENIERRRKAGGGR